LPLSVGARDFGIAWPVGCTIICGDGFLITLSRQSSGEIRRLWDDIVDNRVNPQGFRSSSDIARMLILATAHQYQTGVEELGKRIDRFWRERGSHLPSHKILLTPQAMRQDLEVCGRFAKRIDDALDAVNRGEELTERSIDRVLGASVLHTLGEIRSTITRCEHLIRDGEAGWGSLKDQWRNQILFKLAAISGMAVPVGAWAGIGGMNFSSPLPDSVLWTGLAASAVVSAVLLSRLVAGRREFHRFFASSRTKPLTLPLESNQIGKE